MATATHATHGHAPTTPLAPTTPPPTTPPVINTPLVLSSKQIKIFVYIGIALILFAAIIIINKNMKAKVKAQKAENEKRASEAKSVSDKSSTYDLSKIAYGDSMTFIIQPGFIARLELTNDWCPYWSSGPVDTYDNAGNKRILDGNRFIQGLPLSEKSSYFEFRNTSTHSITIRTGRCKSMDNCTILF